MPIVWYLLGAKAGSFETVSDAQAKQLSDKGEAQIFDGITALRCPENHPHVAAGYVAKPRRTRKKYDNKMLTTGPAGGE